MERPGQSFPARSSRKRPDMADTGTGDNKIVVFQIPFKPVFSEVNKINLSTSAFQKDISSATTRTDP